MADENHEDDTVTFSGSSSDDIENAKAFWKAIDPPLKPKSALVVSGIDQRLPTAPRPQNGKNFAHLTREEADNQLNNPGLIRHLNDAQLQKETEDAQYVQKIMTHKEEAQLVLKRRKQERMQKEEISRRTFKDALTIELSDASDDEEAQQTINDIDKFEERLKQREIIKPS